MRVLMRVSIPVDAGNRAIKDGGLERIMVSTMERLRPEATYFYTDKGQRTALMAFDLKSTSDMPIIAEPFFTELNASVEWFPAMNPDDLKKGLSNLMEHQAAMRR
jgi:hypothetical protein